MVDDFLFRDSAFHFNTYPCFLGVKLIALSSELLYRCSFAPPHNWRLCTPDLTPLRVCVYARGCMYVCVWRGGVNLIHNVFYDNTSREMIVKKLPSVLPQRLRLVCLKNSNLICVTCKIRSIFTPFDKIRSFFSCACGVREGRYQFMYKRAHIVSDLRIYGVRGGLYSSVYVRTCSQCI